ncbi:MAG: M28 family peptidase [Candidatus Riflebacteria bacterium]|nr:M28 family peptidase [Candidatus Riflebacteria bacterium]
MRKSEVVCCTIANNRLALLFLLMYFFIGNLTFASQEIASSSMQAIIGFLASDLLEGRAPGTRGGDIAEAYIESCFKSFGFEPGFGGSYLQSVPLKGSKIQELSINAGSMTLNLEDDIMGSYASDEESFELSAEAIFVGFGITTPIWNWDDYKNVDVKGKLVVTRVNDPGLYIGDIFEGKTLTYFGRWTCHIEEALRRGAAGILLIHTDETAGYNWDVVKNSWGVESLSLVKDSNSSLKFRGWVREKSLENVLSDNGINLQQLYEKSLSRDFEPVPLGLKMLVKGRQMIRDLKANNVVAEIPGKVKESIVLSSHIDHLGIRNSLPDDKNFNGAIDNGSAVAAMLLTAKVLRERQKDLHYSITVLACQAEEAGLLGSRHFVRSIDPRNIIANINFESTPVWERAESIMGVGAEYSTLEDTLKTVARKQNCGYSKFSLVDQGFFFRSDQFPFAHAGVPAVWISAGEDEISGKRKYSSFFKTAYHTPKDEFDPEWPLGGLKQTIEAAVDMVLEINQSKQPPVWKGTPPFPIER